MDCDGNGVGTDSFVWEGVPRQVDTDGDTYGDKWLFYAVSAQCEGFKTRTDTYRMPDMNTAKLYLVPLRKIYPVETTSYHLDPCTNPMATLTTWVKDSDHNPVHETNRVKFWTDYATFASDGSEQHTIVVDTDVNGRAQATIYAGYPNGRIDYCHVMATDDLNTPLPDTYNPYTLAPIYDWEPMAHEGGTIYGQWYLDIAAYEPTFTVTPPDSPPISMKQCEDLLITATLEACGSGIVGQQVTFVIRDGDPAGACPSHSGKLAGGSSILCRQALLVNVPIERGGEDPKVSVAH